MKPGDLIFWEGEQFGHHHLWRVHSVLLGAPGVESLIRLSNITHRPGSNEEGQTQETMLVPECLIRDRVFSGSSIRYSIRETRE